jgi:hypothetical protein
MTTSRKVLIGVGALLAVWVMFLLVDAIYVGFFAHLSGP